MQECVYEKEYEELDKAEFEIMGTVIFDYEMKFELKPYMEKLISSAVRKRLVDTGLM